MAMPVTAARPPHGERRRWIRQKLHTPVYVSFNSPQSGTVVDLSELLDLHENGFAVQTAIPSEREGNDRLEVNRAVTICLDLPETGKYVHGSGQVMWTDDSGRVGVRFTFLPDASRQILKEWLFANLLVASTNHAARASQLARRAEEAGDSPAVEVATPSSTASRTAIQEAIPELVPKLVASSAAVRERDELRAALDDLRREIHDIGERAEAREDGETANANAVLQLITEKAAELTGASGAAIALLTENRIVCRASLGEPTPPLNSEVDVRAGLSGECIRSGRIVRCEDPETDSRVDPEVCRMLGIGSLMAAPIFSDFRVVGLLEIFFPYARSFTTEQEDILERLVEFVPAAKPKLAENKIEAKIENRNAVAPLEDRTAKPEESNSQAPLLTEGLDGAVPEEPPSSRRFPVSPLVLLAIGVAAILLGYLLAPTIERHWLQPGQTAQSLRKPSSKNASGADAITDSAGRNRAFSGEALRKLADQGDAEAQWQLGVLYHDGDSVPKDDVKAVEWFQRAAEQGYVRAESTLGAYYWAGRGVPRDFSKAYFWSQLALAQGDENSKSRLEGLSAQMTPSQVASARQMAESWLRAHNQRASAKAN